NLEAVKQIQTQYRAQPLSQFVGTTPPSVSVVEFVEPLSAEVQKTSPEFFAILNFLLQFAPTHPSETALMERFAKAGIGAGKPFNVTALSPERRRAMEDGIADAWRAFARFKADV